MPTPRPRHAAWVLLALVACAAPPPSGGVAGGAGPDLSGVPADLHACLPPYVRASTGRFFETARVETSGGTEVLVEQVDPDDPGDVLAFRPALLTVEDGACAAVTADGPLAPAVLLASVAPSTYEALVERRYRWRAEAFGGREAFARAWAEARAPRPAVACRLPTGQSSADPDGDCIPQADAAALRALGVEVGGGGTSDAGGAAPGGVAGAQTAPLPGGSTPPAALVQLALMEYHVRLLPSAQFRMLYAPPLVILSEPFGCAQHRLREPKDLYRPPRPGQRSRLRRETPSHQRSLRLRSGHAFDSGLRPPLRMTSS